MLVLTRKLNEEIVIGDNIKVKIAKIDKNQVKIGIVAPKDVIVDRAESRRKTDETRR